MIKRLMEILSLSLLFSIIPQASAEPISKVSIHDHLEAAQTYSVENNANPSILNYTNLAERRGIYYRDYPGYYQSRKGNYQKYSTDNPETEYYSHRDIDEDGFSEFSDHSMAGNRAFVFDPRRLQWFAYDRNGNLVASGRASGGQRYCRDIGRSCRTPSGIFKVHSKGGAYCRSSKYPVGIGGAPMPHCMFFKGGYAIHGSPDVPNYHASHGCIRVLPSAARWLSENFIDYGTTVIVRPY